MSFCLDFKHDGDDLVAEFQGLLLFVWEEDGSWRFQVQRAGVRPGEIALCAWSGFRDELEARAVATMWALGYLAAPSVLSAPSDSSCGSAPSAASSPSPSGSTDSGPSGKPSDSPTPVAATPEAPQLPDITTPAGREAARRLCEAASFGPWVVRETPSPLVRDIRSDRSGDPNAVVLGWQVCRAKYAAGPDLEFIAAARTLLPAALDGLDVLAEEARVARACAEAEATFANELKAENDGLLRIVTDFSKQPAPPEEVVKLREENIRLQVRASEAAMRLGEGFDLKDVMAHIRDGVPSRTVYEKQCDELKRLRAAAESLLADDGRIQTLVGVPERKLRALRAALKPE